MFKEGQIWTSRMGTPITIYKVLGGQSPKPIIGSDNKGKLISFDEGGRYFGSMRDHDFDLVSLQQ